MADKIDYIKDRRGRKRFPITHEKGVRDSNWVRLEEKLKGIEAGKQDTLVPGENIKTIGGQSILGEGNIPVGEANAVKYDSQSLTDAQKEQARSNIGAASSAEVEALANQKFEGPYASASELPEASAQTMGAIYLVGPDSNDEYERKVTRLSNGSYSWASLGNTAIELANYASKESLNGLQAKVIDNTGDIQSLQNQMDNYRPIVIEGNVENAPDEEDITTDENDLLKFANRAAHTNYLGYVILRKGKTFASQVTVQNTIYEIRYDFVLEDDELVTLPSGCALCFNGGKLSGGTIVGQNSSLFIKGRNLVFSDVVISGTWAVTDIYSWWFSNDENTLKNIVSMTTDTEINNIYIEGDYTISSSVDFKSHTSIFMKGTVSGSIAIMFSVNDKDDVHFYGGVLDGLCGQGGAYTTNGGLLYFVYCRDVSVKDMTIKNAKCDAITISRWGGQEKANERFIIENCIIDTAWRQGVSIASAKNFRMSNCGILNIWGTAPGAALDFENNTSLECEKIENVVIENVFIKDTHSGILFPDQHDNPAENIYIKNVDYSSSYNHRGNWLIPGISTTVENCKFSCDSTQDSYLIISDPSITDVVFRNCSFNNNNLRFSSQGASFDCCTFIGRITSSGRMVAFNSKFKIASSVSFTHAENCEIEISASTPTDYVSLFSNGRFLNNRLTIKGETYYSVAMGMPASQCTISGNIIESEAQRATIILIGSKHIARNNRIFDVRQKSYGAIAEYNFGHRCQVYLNNIVCQVWIYASPAIKFSHPSLNYSKTGATADRPQVLKQEDIGFKFYDKTLEKFIYLKDNGKYPKFKLQLSASDLNNAQAAFVTDFGISETDNIPAQTTLAGLTQAIADSLKPRLADVHSVNTETGEIVFCVARNQALAVSDIVMTLGGNPLGTLTLTEAGVASTWIDATGTAV